MLVVDDETELAAAIGSALDGYGFEPICVTTLAEARSHIERVDLILLDLGLPDGDGLTACAGFATAAPLIVISARAGETDRVVALELGADDFLLKPFSTRELVARSRAVLRRAGGRAARRVRRVADLDIDVDAFEVRRDGAVIALTTKEIELMIALSERPGVAVRRSDLALRVWGADLGVVNRTLDVHVSSLRAKLGPDPSGADYLVTVHGVGYRLRT